MTSTSRLGLAMFEAVNPPITQCQPSLEIVREENGTVKNNTDGKHESMLESAESPPALDS
jgi:hypothetical protein